MNDSEGETWSTGLEQARKLLASGDEGRFLTQALLVYQQHPDRAEPLYDVVRYYRERGMTESALLFCQSALALAGARHRGRTTQRNECAIGLVEELSILGFYARDQKWRPAARMACEALATRRDLDEVRRHTARANLRFYAPLLHEIAPSFQSSQIDFQAPPGFRPTNPSVAFCRGGLWLIQRCVNWELGNDGQYETQDNAPFTTRNFLTQLDENLRLVGSMLEILPPIDLPVPKFGLVLGFEDCRLFEWRGDLWCSATVRELTQAGWCQIVLARIDREHTNWRLSDWQVISEPDVHNKNWMPQVSGTDLRFIYGLDPTRIVDEHGSEVTTMVPPLAVEDLRGGSQAIPFEGGWLALVHQVAFRGNERHYLHRFVWLDANNALHALSHTFRFSHSSPVEFAAGLAWHSDGERLVISYGVGDSQSWLGVCHAKEIAALLRPPAGLSGHARVSNRDREVS